LYNESKGENKMNKITSVTRLPHNAFGDFRDVPSTQDNYYRKEHKCTTGGLKNALERVTKELREYSKSHGNMAVCAGWIETPHGKFGVAYGNYLIDYKFSNSDELKTCMEDLNNILDQVNRELDERDRLEREELKRKYPEGYGY
jgi:hypothetical protein